MTERDKIDRSSSQRRVYSRQFTIRKRRVSGVETEMDKIKLGFGDMFVYGFESEPGSDRMYPWFIGNLEILRDYYDHGGRSAGEQRNKGPGGSHFEAFNLDDMPLGFILASDGLAVAVCAYCGELGADTFYYEVKDWSERQSEFAHHALHWRCCPMAVKEGRCVVCFKPGAPMTNLATVGGPAHANCIDGLARTNERG
ncbi:MAG: hypothetical protein ACRDSF_00455 [Pseudonocardiaceae bacterium]